MKVLFVCTANACRSVIAAAVCKQLSAINRLDWMVRSSGIAAESYFKVPREVHRLVQDRLGMDISSHVPRLVTEDWVDWADKIFVMEEGHRVVLLERYPQSRRKVVPLDLDGDVPDPIGKDASAYAACFDRIHFLLQRIVDEFKKDRA